MHFVTFLFIFVVSAVYGQDRKIYAQLNPGCNDCHEDVTLVYIKATGPHDSIHQIWDFTRSLPTVIFAIGSVNSTLLINWNRHLVKDFVFSSQPKYSFAAVIDKVIEFDDLPDNGYYTPELPQRGYSLDHIRWRRENNSVLTDDEAKVTVRGQLWTKDGHKGRINIKLDYIPFEDYSTELPHLIHTANSTLFDVSLVNLTSTREFNASRFGLHFLLASTDNMSDTMRYYMRKSLDDEHTPGVFEIVEIKTPESFRADDGGYIQFRPVAYNQPERGVTTSTLAHIFIFFFNHTFLPQSSTVERFFTGSDPNKLLVQDMLISFGETGDGYYKQHNYTAWSFTIGYGAPPLEGFSLFVIVIICVGLGVPVLLAMSGVIYVLVRRYKARRNTPARLVEDD